MIKLLKKLLLYWKYRNIHLKNEGKNCKYKSFRTKITSPEKISLGNEVNLGPGSELHGEGGITIGNGVIFAPEVIVYTRSHYFDGENLEALPFDNKIILQAVSIDDFVWIGRKVIILPGVHIGKGAVVGAGSVVSKSIPDYGIAVGNPARVVKFRDKENFDRLQKEPGSFVYEKLGHKKIFTLPENES